MKIAFQIYIAIAIVISLSFSQTMAQEIVKPNAKEPSAKEPSAKEPSKTEFVGATVEVYKTVGKVELKAWIFKPSSINESQKLPAAIFFFGGGWRGGSPKQFVEHCKYLRSRGMIGIVVDYRVSSRHPVKVVDCIADAKSAVRWVRLNSERLGIDPERIAAGGGSAGGHLAAATATVAGFDSAEGQTSISCRPNVLILFNPAVVLAGIPGKAEMNEERLASLTKRAGVEPSKISPYHGDLTSAPPTFIVHGKADTTVPYQSVEFYTEKMHANNRECRLIGYENQQHGFFNFGKSGLEYFNKTVAEMDAFLVSLGYLKTKGKIEKAGK
jgi:acetyl esterase